MTIFVATANNHTYTGSADFDYVDYRNEPGAIYVDLTKGTVTRSNGAVKLRLGE